MRDEAELLRPRDPLRRALTAAGAPAFILSTEFGPAVFRVKKTLQSPRAGGYSPQAVHASASANLGRLEKARAVLDKALAAKPALSSC